MNEQKQKTSPWKQEEIVLAKGAKCALIQIKDRGIGISATNIKRIFDPFFTTKTVGGTGLGLAMVKAIVNAHKGIIRVTSKQGEETIFSIYLPIKG